MYIVTVIYLPQKLNVATVHDFTLNQW